ncbi:hypothetical protein ES703_39297 [subsurface metagenome]
MNEALEIMNLGDWYACWEPDLDLPHEGKCYPDDKSIVICSTDEGEAMDVLVHEILELKLRPVLGAHMAVINQLNSVIQDFLYEEKERMIEDMIPFLLQSIEEKLREKGEEGESG